MQPKSRRLVTEQNLEEHTDSALNPVRDDVAAANQKSDNALARVEQVETIAGLAPGEVTDAQTASLLHQPESATREAFGQAMATEFQDQGSVGRTALNAATTEIIHQTVPPIPDGVVTSPNSVNLVLTDNPDYEGQDGDLVFYYSPRNAFSNFSQGLEGFTDRWHPGWDVVESPGGFVAQSSGDSARRALSWDVFDESTSTVELVANMVLVEQVAGNTLVGGLILGGAGDDQSETGHILSIRRNADAGPMNQLNFSRFDNAAYENLLTAEIPLIEVGESFWMRFRMEGTRLRGKIWSAAELEPDWLAEVTAPSLTAGGWFGLFTGSRATVQYSTLGVDLDGGTAPMEDQ